VAARRRSQVIAWHRRRVRHCVQQGAQVRGIRAARASLHIIADSPCFHSRGQGKRNDLIHAHLCAFSNLGCQPGQVIGHFGFKGRQSSFRNSRRNSRAITTEIRRLFAGELEFDFRLLRV
jgi:hypothetical protein